MNTHRWLCQNVNWVKETQVEPINAHKSTAIYPWVEETHFEMYIICNLHDASVAMIFISCITKYIEYNFLNCKGLLISNLLGLYWMGKMVRSAI